LRELRAWRLPAPGFFCAPFPPQMDTAAAMNILFALMNVRFR